MERNTNYTEYTERDTYGMYKVYPKVGPGPELMGVDTLIGNGVYIQKGDKLGEIKDVMLDMRSGRVAYAVLSFGGFVSMGEKLFAVPWNALTLDTATKRFKLNVDKDRLKTAPGFDKDHWPNMADATGAQSIHSYNGTKPYSDEPGLTADQLRLPACRRSNRLSHLQRTFAPSGTRCLDVAEGVAP